MGPFEVVGLSSAAFMAGAVNAVAGGGSLISFPTLLAFGYPSVSANVTNTVAIWPGTVGGSLAYRQELDGQGKRIVVLGGASIVGALAGSALLLTSPTALFDRLVPFLILGACALLAFQAPLSRWVNRHRPASATDEWSGPLIGAQILAAVYGAYFGAGLGIMLLAALGIFLPDALHRLNALKGLLAFIINGVAVVIFALFGPVIWSVALLMAVTSWAGGYVGVHVSRRISNRLLRWLVLSFGVASAIAMML